MRNKKIDHGDNRGDTVWVRGVISILSEPALTFQVRIRTLNPNKDFWFRSEGFVVSGLACRQGSCSV